MSQVRSLPGRPCGTASSRSCCCRHGSRPESDTLARSHCTHATWQSNRLAAANEYLRYIFCRAERCLPCSKAPLRNLMKHANHRQPFDQIMNFQNYVSPIVRVIPGQYAGLPSQFEGPTRVAQPGSHRADQTHCESLAPFGLRRSIFIGTPSSLFRHSRYR